MRLAAHVPAVLPVPAEQVVLRRALRRRSSSSPRFGLARVLLAGRRRHASSTACRTGVRRTDGRRLARRWSRSRPARIAVYAFVMLIGVVRAGRHLPPGPVTSMNAAGFPMLSLITWLPLVGGADHHVGARRRGDRRLQRALDRAVDQPDRLRCCRLMLWVKFDQAEAGFQFVEKRRLAAGIRRRLQDGRGRHLGAVRAALHRADADLHPGELGVDHAAGCASTCSPS